MVRVTSDDLKRLPLRAIVAFAARCARRVRPLYWLPADHPEKSSHVTTVDHAIGVAEDVARGGVVHDISGPFDLTDPAKAARDTGIYTAATAADAAAAAALAAEYAVASATKAASAHEAEEVVACAQSAAEDASRAAAYAGDGYTVDVAAHADLHKLLSLDLGCFPDLGQHVDPAESSPLGPLWPDGEPAWYREAKARVAAESPTGEPALPPLDFLPQSVEAGTRPVAPRAGGTTVVEPLGPMSPDESESGPPLTIYLDPGDAPQELIEELFVALSALYQAHGGSGLKFVNDEQRLFVGEALP